MPQSGFRMPVDEFDRWPVDLASSGGTLTVDISGAANGGFLPGDRNELQEKFQIVRITATKDCWILFSSGADQTAATANDMLFIAGTERQALPLGTCFVSALTFDPAATGKLSITVMQ